MRINHNLASLNTYRQLSNNQALGSKSLEKLSSGFRINRAGDDAAGLAISEKMRGQIRGLDQAARNGQDAISLIQTAEGALNETHSILQRMRELSVQSANATNTDEDRVSLQDEVKQLKSEIDRIGNNTEFNTMKLINGDMDGSIVGSQGQALGEATAAYVKVEDFDASAAITANTTSWIQVNVDGHTFNLSGIDGADTFEYWNNFKDALSDAISTYNADNDTNVQMPTFEILDVQSAASMDFKITSATTGTSSKLEIRALDPGDGNAAAYAAADLMGSMIDTTNATLGTDGLFTGSSASSIEDLASAALEFTMTVNGHEIQVDLTAVTAAFDVTDTMADYASALQVDINDALADYEALTGTDFGTVSVTVSEGRLQIDSSAPDTTTIEFETSSATTTLGIGGTSTTSGGLDFHIGANKDQQLNLQINDMRAAALDVADVDISTADGANNAIAAIDTAIKSVSSERAKLGAYQNRLEHTINNLGTSSENMTAAESRIRDVDMAKEMMEFTKNNILTQAAQGMLAQANQQPQGVLQLLR